MLSDSDIILRRSVGDLDIYPWQPDECLQPASYDLHLDGHWIKRLNSDVYPDAKPEYETISPSFNFEGTSYFIFHPNELYLATTEEVVTLSRFVAAKVEGRSSMGRMGLSVHVTAGFIDPGFIGQITLEISVVGQHTIDLPANQKIAQICFFPLDSPAANPYNGHYQNQRGVTPPDMSVLNVA